MTAVSFRMLRGVDGFLMSDVVVGADAPTTNYDFEFRFQVLDLQSKNINDFDIVRSLKAMIRWIEIGGGSTGGNNYTSITNQPSGPPN